MYWEARSRLAVPVKSGDNSSFQVSKVDQYLCNPTDQKSGSNHSFGLPGEQILG